MMYIINTVDSDQQGYVNYMEYDILRKQMIKPTPTQNYIYITKYNCYQINRHTPNSYR